MPQEIDAITRFVRCCDPVEALPPGDKRYVSCEQARGGEFLENYVRCFSRADPDHPLARAFAGHIGIGKSTELLRLKKRLEEANLRVIYFDVSGALDPNDLDFPDLLVYMAGQIRQQLDGIAKEIGCPIESSLLSGLWDELKGLLQGEVHLKAEGKVPYLPLAMEIVNQPSARKELRRAIEAQSTNLLHAVRDLLGSANVELRRRGFLGLVILCDGTEKVVRRPLDDRGTTTHERLFVNRAPQLAKIGTHVLYSLPISLIYDPAFTQMVEAFGESTPPLPMVRLRPDDHADITPDTTGMKVMWEMIEARCRCANVDIGDVFDDPQTGHYLSEMSGGHPRHLVMFLRSAANSLAALPITRGAAEKAVRDYANGLLRGVPKEDWWPILRRFAEPADDLPKDEPHLQMLLLEYIFEYMNDNVWYEANPVLRTLDKFNPAG